MPKRKRTGGLTLNITSRDSRGRYRKPKHPLIDLVVGTNLGVAPLKRKPKSKRRK